jgi:ssDNA-binding Zn-finger/Zn-ribbon topoisomerase 1
MDFRIIKRAKISLPKDLLKVTHDDLTRAKSVFGDTLVELCNGMPPIVIAEGDTYSLVARHLSFVIFVEKMDADKIPVLIADKSERKSVSKSDKIMFDLISKEAESLASKNNKAGVSRRERKSLGYECPFCGLLIKGTKGSMPVAAEGNYQGYYLLSCFSSQVKEVPCGFQAYLTREEYLRFRNRNYPLSEWLAKTDQSCPKCGKPLYSRNRLGKKMLFCEDYFRAKGACQYGKAVEEN